jgi:phage terminase large subunit
MTYQEQNENQVNLTSVIGPSFYDVHDDIQLGKHTHYDLDGGRGSLKSSFISVEIIIGMNKDVNANAIIYRKVGDTLRTSVYEQMIWAIDILKQNSLWRATVTPMEITYIPTGQKILFKGLDKAKKSKSMKLAKGYFKFGWFEEADEFDGMEEIRTVEQSIMRGGDKFCIFKSWNPPKSLNAWVNQEALIEREDKLKHHSTYLEAPRAWLGEAFIKEAKELKRTNPKAYEHEYLGVATGTGGKVFENVTIREITDDEIAVFDKIKQGLDFGFAADPLSYVKTHYDKVRKRLFIFGEIYQVGLSNTKLANSLKLMNPLNKVIVADSEEPRTINDLQEKGISITGAKKGPDSIDRGIHFLSIEIIEIVIDKRRCPNTAREFTSYELERDKNGNFKGSYPDKNNHSIDATRYALEDEMVSRKAKVKNKSNYGFN